MTLLKQLQAHKGSLIQLKTQLYWHDGRGYDGTPGRICLILDASTSTFSRAVARTPRTVSTVPRGRWAAAFLLIDGQPQWIWAAEEDIELLVNDPPAN